MTKVSGPALGLLELESLARGVVVADALVKKAAVHIALAEPVSPGKYLLVFSGQVAEVDESFREGIAVAGKVLIDRLYLPFVAEGVVSALAGRYEHASDGDSIGLVETHTVASALLAADTALKRARVGLTQLHLAKGIGGKGWFMVAGAQPDVEAALEGAAAAVASNLLVTTELIQRPHPDLHSSVLVKGAVP